MKTQRRGMWKNSWKDEHGFTLVEVMVAFALLLLALQLLIYGSAVARKMEKRASEYAAAADLLHENLSDESECTAGTLRLKLDEGTELVGEGWLYQHETDDQIVVRAVRVDEGT